MGMITRHPRQIFLHVDEVVAGHTIEEALTICDQWSRATALSRSRD
jgi:hypothetical protein